MFHMKERKKKKIIKKARLLMLAEKDNYCAEHYNKCDGCQYHDGECLCQTAWDDLMKIESRIK